MIVIAIGNATGSRKGTGTGCPGNEVGFTSETRMDMVSALGMDESPKPSTELATMFARGGDVVEKQYRTVVFHPDRDLA